MKQKHLPPIADKDLLVKNCSVWAEEGHWVESVRTERVLKTHMVGLTLLLGVGVVATKDETVAGEGGLLNSCQDRIVQSWLSWDGVPQPVQRITSLVF